MKGPAGLGIVGIPGNGPGGTPIETPEAGSAASKPDGLLVNRSGGPGAEGKPVMGVVKPLGMEVKTGNEEPPIVTVGWC